MTSTKLGKCGKCLICAFGRLIMESGNELAERVSVGILLEMLNIRKSMAKSEEAVKKLSEEFTDE